MMSRQKRGRNVRAAPCIVMCVCCAAGRSQGRGYITTFTALLHVERVFASRNSIVTVSRCNVTQIKKKSVVTPLLTSSKDSAHSQIVQYTVHSLFNRLDSESPLRNNFCENHTSLDKAFATLTNFGGRNPQWSSNTGPLLCYNTLWQLNRKFSLALNTTFLLVSNAYYSTVFDPFTRSSQ